MNLEEEISTETNHIKESESRTSTDAGSYLSEKDKGKKSANDLSEIYKSRVLFPSALEADSSRKKQEAHNEELMKLFKQVHINLPQLNTI